MTTYKPGSFFLAAAEGWAGYGIALGQTLAGSPSRYTHAGIILADDGTCVEAEPGGARYGNVNAYRHVLVSDAPVQTYLANNWHNHFGDDDEQAIRLEVTRQAHQFVGIGYSMLDYLALALLHLHLPSRWVRERVQRSGRVICSQLVDAVYERAGIHLFNDGPYDPATGKGRLPGDVMPSDLAAWAEDHQ